VSGANPLRIAAIALISHVLHPPKNERGPLPNFTRLAVATVSAYRATHACLSIQNVALAHT
jgi:hypothetical protein